MRRDFAKNGRAQRLYVYWRFMKKRLKKVRENMYKQIQENTENEQTFIEIRRLKNQ